MTDNPASRKHGKNAFFFVLVTVAIDMLGFGLIIPVVPSLVQEMLHIPPEDATLWLGTLAATYALMNFIFGPIVGALSDRYGRRLVLLVSIGTLLLGGTLITALLFFTFFTFIYLYIYYKSILISPSITFSKERIHS